MILLHRPCCPSSTHWRLVLVSVSMAILIIVLVALVIHFSASAHGQGGPSYSRAEPVRQEGGRGGEMTTLVFPFEKDLWMNASSLSRCPKHFFSCGNSSSMCLVLDKRCDGRVDCPNAEDELNCVCAFRMPAAKFCDKYPDCFDESDESFCSYCPEHSFNCGDGKCVPRNKVCDSEVDCDNFMDENFCFRLSSNVGIASVEGSDPTSPTIPSLRSGFLLRNKNGAWYPVCANPHDYMQSSLASFACVSITANPLSASSHHYRRFTDQAPSGGDYIYHYMGRFVQWRGCVTDSGLYVACDDVRCGLNPQHLLPRRPRGRIVGGEVSKPGAWPWHAAVYKNGTYACGATLVSDRWLVSAAHCFLNHRFNYYEVQLGMLRRRSFTPHQKTYPIDSVSPHQKFNVVTLEYDIVLLRTTEKVDFDFWVRPICLPSPKKQEAVGSVCTAIGWGDKGEMEEDSDDLQQVQVPLTKACKRNPDRWLCAGYAEGGRDACQGDSGGPLMCLHQNGLSWYIAGVISAGTGCARPQTPGMYTRVVYFLDWIQKVVASGTNEGVPPLLSCPGWRCPTLGGGNCLRTEKVCDGHVDCYDAQDEVDCIGKRKKRT